MKYWAYLNDDVSQKPFTEEELQQLPGFGPEMLICSEVSAVSQDPEWKPVKEILPHLIRPKAPDFSKFRPKPPVPSQQGNADVLPVSQSLPAGVSATPFAQPTSIPQDNNIAGLDNNLLAQLRSLTSKIESLENKIDEQEKELAAANLNQDYEQENDETFVSEPQNEQEDDVLEVPFDSDFEVPFDANKSSEEIAREAEEMLAKPNSTEIEEYDTDDQNTELMNYTSDMQKILEDTIRESNFYSEQAAQPKKKKERKTLIAEDLVSKEKLKFSVEEEKKDKKEEDKQPENKEENKENIPQEQHNEENKQEEVPANAEKETEVKSLTELIAGKPGTDESKEQNQESTSQLTSVEDAPEKREEKPVHEEEKQELRLTSVAEAPKGNKEEPVKEEEAPEPQLTSVEKAPENKMQEPVQEEVTVEPQLVSVEDAIAKENEETPKEEPVKEEPQVAPETEGEEVNPEEPAEEPVQEEVQEELKVAPETEGEEVKQEESVEEPVQEEPQEDEGLKTFALDEFSDGSADVITEEAEGEQSEKSLDEEQVQEEPKVAPETEGEEVQLEDPFEENQSQVESIEEELKVAPEPEEESKSNFDEIVNKVEVPADLENTNVDEKTSDLSKTQEVTISEDDTTAAVLSEIAEEKAQDVRNMTTSDQLFAELENTYRNEDLEKKDIKITGENKDTTLEVDLNQDIAKEDEFLKTFTTSVEEVFLDQPTAIISDYVPPTDNVEEHTKPEELENSIKREKPSDIKTVPLVPEVLGQEIHSSPYVESATAKLRQTSPIVNALKWTAIGIVVAMIVMGALSGLAVMGKIPEKLSPLHAIIYSFRKPQPQQVNNSIEDDMDLAPEMINQVQGSDQERMSEQAQIDAVIEQVRGYTFPDGTTLEDRIQNIHGNVSDQIEWSLFPTEEKGIYSIAVKIPQNQNGQGFSYRFNYDFDGNKLDPTTSEAKNIMENYSR